MAVGVEFENDPSRTNAAAKRSLILALESGDIPEKRVSLHSV
jgi:hypothetical protein